jgi:hypothetical protein
MESPGQGGMAVEGARSPVRGLGLTVKIMVKVLVVSWFVFTEHRCVGARLRSVHQQRD